MAKETFERKKPHVNVGTQNYAGKLTEPEILSVFERGSSGRFGTSLDYLIKTVSSLREHGLRDPHLEKLARHAGVQVPKM